MKQLHIVILGCAIVVLALAAVLVKKGSEHFSVSVCSDPFSRSFVPYKCYASQQGFQEYCMKQVLDNGTVSPLIAEQMCKSSDPYIWSVPYNL